MSRTRAMHKKPGLLWIYFVLILIIILSLQHHNSLPKPPHLIISLSPGFGLDKHHDKSNSAGSSSSPLPRKIWQIFSTPAHSTSKPPNSIDPKSLGDTTSWIGLNPGYQYELLGAASADAFVVRHFSHDKAVMQTYFALQNPGLKTDLLRYLVLWVEGGVYADLDTWAIKPVDLWVPAPLQGRVRAVVGLEWDQLDGEPWPGFGDEPSCKYRYRAEHCHSSSILTHPKT